MGVMAMTGEIFDMFLVEETEVKQSEAFAEPEFWPGPKVEQQMLFDIEEPWEKIWKGMPEYSQEDLTSWKQLIIHFASPGDLIAFASLIEQKLTPKTRSIWFPDPEKFTFMNKRYSDAA